MVYRGDQLRYRISTPAPIQGRVRGEQVIVTTSTGQVGTHLIRSSKHRWGPPVHQCADSRRRTREYRVARNDPQTIFDLEMDRYLLDNGIIHELEWITAE